MKRHLRSRLGDPWALSQAAQAVEKDKALQEDLAVWDVTVADGLSSGDGCYLPKKRINPSFGRF